LLVENMASCLKMKSMKPVTQTKEYKNTKLQAEIMTDQ